MDMPLSQAIALAVAILLALAFVSVLASVKMSQGGVDPRRRRQVLTSLWLLVLGLIALLFALMVLSGGPVIGGSPAAGMWLGLKPRQMVALALAVVLLVIGYARLRGILAPLEAAGPIAPAPDEPAGAADDETP